MEFTLYSKYHILYIVAYTIITITLCVMTKVSRRKDIFMKYISVFIVLLKVYEVFYRVNYLGQDLKGLLPLHLCNLTLLISAIAIFTENKTLFQLNYYWGVGAIAAILFPEVRAKFPSILNISFFMTHYFIFYTGYCGREIYNWRPTFNGYIKAVTYINILMVGIFFINEKLGTNYMFINKVPDFSSPISYFGPWPYYIIPLEILGAILFYLVYMPYKGKKNRYYL